MRDVRVRAWRDGRGRSRAIREWISEGRVARVDMLVGCGGMAVRDALCGVWTSEQVRGVDAGVG